MKGYFRNPAATSAALAGGWLHTGDLGSVDDLGYYYFEDRLKDMIKSGGINIYSREIEDVISLHPKVKEVAVIGLPDPKWGEAVCAVVVPHTKGSLSAEEIIECCKLKLDSHKKPRSVIFPDAPLPRGANGGKILKKILRDQYAK
jgi:acyl-CoA synthetase (AMP-forming)/AMP-acid ligase II